MFHKREYIYTKKKNYIYLREEKDKYSQDKE